MLSPLRALPPRAGLPGRGTLPGTAPAPPLLTSLLGLTSRRRPCYQSWCTMSAQQSTKKPGTLLFCPAVLQKTQQQERQGDRRRFPLLEC